LIVPLQQFPLLLEKKHVTSLLSEPSKALRLVI